jgi:chromosome segregation ATPase
MKKYLSTALALICAVLVISVVVIKHGDNAQHESDASAIADFSNRLDSAQLQIATCNGNILKLSNSLDESQTTALMFSNQLMESQSTIALDAEQITNLSRQIAQLASDKQTLSQSLVGLNSQMTNQVADLTTQIASTQASLDLANKNYALLENRFRIDVAERVVAERKFNNLLELKSQIQKLKQNPAEEISAGDIYADLDVEVKSNAFHVIFPN